jgi:hypothetical protein
VLHSLSANTTPTLVGLVRGKQGLREGGSDRRPPADFLEGCPQITRGLMDMVRKIGIIALITAGVAILQRLVGWIARKIKPAQVVKASCCKLFAIAQIGKLYQK